MVPSLTEWMFLHSSHTARKVLSEELVCSQPQHTSSATSFIHFLKFIKTVHFCNTPVMILSGQSCEVAWTSHEISASYECGHESMYDLSTRTFSEGLQFHKINK